MTKKSFKLRNMAAIAICFAGITILSGCDKEKTPAISVSDNNNLTQEVYADNLQGKSGVNFTTAGAWTSSISTAPSGKSAQMKETKSTPDWISISPDAGKEAGSYTIAITLKTNTTGADRTATITISCNGSDVAITVTQKGVKEDGTVPEAGIGLETNNVSLTVGDSLILKEISGKPVTFMSSNSGVVAVRPHPDGYPHACEIYAVSVGNAVITATATDGSSATTCTVTVTKGSGGGGTTTVQLDPDVMSLTVGESEILKEIGSQTVTFISSNPGVAAVRPHPDGYPHACEIYAASVGNAVITATVADGSSMATCTVTVTKGNGGGGTTIQLDPDVVSFAVGESLILKEIGGQPVTFTSGNSGVVAILPHPDGYPHACKISAVGVGNTVITATADDGSTATCTVTVK